jgi:transposase-like protein
VPQNGKSQAGEPYPRTLDEFDELFSTEEACEAYLVALRWPGGFLCPRCGGTRAWRKARARLACTACRHEASITAGTVFHKTRKPLRTWFRAMWWVTSQKTGGSALGLQRILGLPSYQTAWLWLQKLRRAMVRPGRDRLRGSVEIDETYVGGNEAGVYGRETRTKSIVAIAAEEAGQGIGRIRLRRVRNVSGASLLAFVQEVVEPGSAVHTDAWRGYGDLVKTGYRHKVTNVKRSEKLAHELLPRVHRVAALLKRWILGTHQGSVSAKHLDYYLDEFTFRFNRRASRHRGKLFFRLLQQAAAVGPTTYDEVVGRTGDDADPHG